MHEHILPVFMLESYNMTYLMNIKNIYELKLLEITCLGECVHARILQNGLTHEQYEHTCLGECVHAKLMNIVNMYEH